MSESVQNLLELKDVANGPELERLFEHSCKKLTSGKWCCRSPNDTTDKQIRSCLAVTVTSADKRPTDGDMDASFADHEADGA